MRTIFAIADPHWGHKNILKFTGNDGKRIRPFSSVEEMDELMVTNWNSVVTSDSDIVYLCGDVTMDIKNFQLIAKRLRGRKRLILGNHDDGDDYELTRWFQKVRLWRIFKDEGIVLTHFPLREDQFRHKVKYNGHGHIHQNLVLQADGTPDPQFINLCVEHNNYTPISLDQLKAKMK